MRLTHHHTDDKHCECIRCLAERTKGYRIISRPAFGCKGSRDATGYERISDAFNEFFTPYTDLGGYTIEFVADDCTVLCAECAKRAFITDHVDIYAATYDEGPIMYCEDCDREIVSSYGDPYCDHEPNENNECVYCGYNI